MPFAKVEGKAFEVLADSYVTAEDGTGIVHIAPAYGEDDSRVAKANGISFFSKCQQRWLLYCWTLGGQRNNRFRT